jgi:hypothetical protein
MGNLWTGNLGRLDVVDDRTPGQLAADGDDYWPDGRLYTPPQFKEAEFWPADKPRRITPEEWTERVKALR